MKKTLLHNGILIKRKPPVNYSAIKQAESFIKLEEFIEPCYLCELNNAYVSPYGMVFKNGQVVKESVYSMFTGNKNVLTFYKKILFNKVKKVTGDCLIAHNAYYDNYYHWTMEAMPRIYSVKKHTPDLKLLIHQKLKPFIEFYVSLFPFKDIIYLKDDELVLAEKLWLPMHTAPGLRHNELLVREMANHIKQMNPYDTSNADYEKIFISRNKATFRKAVNEAQAFNIFKEYGFHKVVLEELPVSQQIKLLRGVKVYAGIHGAGFSNLMYMDNGNTLIDIIHEDHPQDAFYNLACAFDVDYIRLDCKGVGLQKYCGSDDIQIDLSNLKTTLTGQL